LKIRIYEGLKGNFAVENLFACIEWEKILILPRTLTELPVSRCLIPERSISSCIWYYRKSDNIKNIAGIIFRMYIK
jgi:hypothetical protein